MKKSRLAFIPVALLAVLATSCDASTSKAPTTDSFEQITGAQWVKPLDKSEIQTGTVLLLSKEGKSPKSLSNGAFVLKDAKYGRIETDQELIQLRVYKYANGTYRLYNKDGKYLAAKDKTLTFSDGETFWTVNEDDGRYYFSPNETDLFLAYNEIDSSLALENQSAGLDVYLGYEEKFVYPTGISINGSDDVEINEALPLNITCVPADTTEKEVVWYSSNESIASISEDGIVSGKDVGEVTITAVSKYDSRVTAQYVVNVIPKKIRVTDMSLAYSQYILYENEEPQKVVATVYPSDATNKNVSWSSSNSNIVTIDQDGNITPVSKGEATITAVTEDGNIKRTAKVTVKQAKQKQEWQLVTGEAELSTDYEVILVAGDFNAVAGKFTRTYFAKETNNVFSTDKTNIEELSENASKLILSKDSSGYYSFTNSDGKKLGTNRVGSLSFSSGETRWSISFDSGNAYIKSANESYGRIQYSDTSANQKFSNFTSEESPIQIYRNKHFEKVYPTSINIEGEGTLSIDGNIQYSLSYEPANTNIKKVSWTINNSNVATISNRGYLTAINEGYTQLVVEGIGANGSKVVATKDIHVKPINVTGVSLNYQTKEVAINKSFNLVPTIYPSNATHKEITFISEDPSIASVNQDGKVTALQEGSTVIKVVTTDGGFEASTSVNVVESKPSDWTIMIYMCGADLESYSGLATMDIAEILSVNNQPDDVNIIIQTGGAYTWKRYNIDSSYHQRWHVENKSLVLDSSINDANMGDPNTFKNFMKWGLTEYPADKTGVIMWNHGGAMSGVCFDEKHYSDSLCNSEVSQGMEEAFEELGRTEKLEWIGYDACLMAVQDIAEFNSKYFNYMVSSEEAESGYGWDYDGWVDDLYAGKPTETVLKAICDSFLTSVGTYSDQTLSVSNLNYMENYKNTFETLAEKLSTKITSSNRSSFNSLVKSATSYTDSVSSYGIFDAKDFLNKLNNNSTFNPGGSYIANTIEAYDNLVIYNRKGSQAGSSSGMCLYWASSSGCRKGTYYTSSQTNFNNWRSIVSTYGY